MDNSLNENISTGFQEEPIDEGQYKKLGKNGFSKEFRKCLKKFFSKMPNYKKRKAQYEYIGEALGLSGTYIKKMIESFMISSIDYFISICFVLRLDSDKVIELANEYIYEIISDKKRIIEMDLIANRQFDCDARLNDLIDMLDEFKEKIYDNPIEILKDVNNNLVEYNYPLLDIPSLNKNNKTTSTNKIVNSEIRRFVRIHSREWCNENILTENNTPHFEIEAVIAYKINDFDRLYVVSSADILSYISGNISHRWYLYNKDRKLIDNYFDHGMVDVPNAPISEDDSNSYVSKYTIIAQRYKQGWSYEKSIELYNDYYKYTDLYLKKIVNDKIKDLNDTRNYKERIGASIIDGKEHIIYETYNYDYPERHEYFYMDYYDSNYILKISKNSIFMSEYAKGSILEDSCTFNNHDIISVFKNSDEIANACSKYRYVFPIDLLEIYERLKKKIDDMLNKISKGIYQIVSDYEEYEMNDDYSGENNDNI